MKIETENREFVEGATNLAKQMMDVCEGAPSKEAALLAAAGAFVGFARAMGLTPPEAQELIKQGMTAEEIDLSGIDGIEPIETRLDDRDRALLAGMAMQGLITRDAFRTDPAVRSLRQAIAEEAVAYADALIAELRKEQGE